MNSRYARQILVPQIGSVGQEQLANSKVLLVGLGGLGSVIGAQLAGAGVGKITLVDHDTIALSNLNRQLLFRESDVDSLKAEVTARELIALNSSISVTTISSRLSPSNVASLVDGVDLVIDAADNFATSYILSDACVETKTPLLSASVNRSFGYVGVFCAGQGKQLPSVRALFPKLSQEQTSCDLVGVTGPSVGVIASLQAQEALKILIADEAALYAKILYADLWAYRFHSIDFSTAKEPNTSQIQFISEASLETNDIVIDVRNTEEILSQPQSCRVDHNIPLGEIALQTDILAALLEQKRAVFICKSGQRALIAAQRLLDAKQPKVAVIIPSH